MFWDAHFLPFYVEQIWFKMERVDQGMCTLCFFLNPYEWSYQSFFFFQPVKRGFSFVPSWPPLSPFLFFLVGEALCRIIGDANLVSGFKPARVALVVNHLQFFNDILNFCDVEEDQIINEQQHITTLFLSKLIHHLCWSSIFLYVDDMLFFFIFPLSILLLFMWCVSSS